MNITTSLLPHSKGLSANERHHYVEACLVCTIHITHCIIHILPLGPFKPFAIPNKHISQGTKDKSK